MLVSVRSVKGLYRATPIPWVKEIFIFTTSNDHLTGPSLSKKSEFYYRIHLCYVCIEKFR